MRLVERRRLIKKTRIAAEKKITQLVVDQLQSRFRSLKRELRKGNFRKRMRKFTKADPLPGAIQPGNTGWNDWIDVFTEELILALMDGADKVGSIENVIWMSRGYPQFIVDLQMVIDRYQARTGRQIKNIAEATRDNTLQAISDWFNTDAGLPTLIENLEEYFDEPRATLIATTEMGYVASEVADEQMGEYGITKFIWDSFDDWLTCEQCSELDGQVFDRGEPMPPEASHPNCILPGNEVVAPDILAATKSFYTGPVVEFRTANGSRLSVTENHPILTTRGWMRAKLLCKGDQIVRATDIQRIVQTINPNYNQVPTAIEKVFASLKESFGTVSTTVKAAPKQFHGDGSFDGYVEIVYSNRLLLGDCQPTLAQPAGQDIFGSRGSGRIEAPFYAERMNSFFFNAPHPSTGSFVGSLDLFCSLPGAHAFPLNGFGFGLGSSLYPFLSQDSPDNFPIDPKLARQFVLRFSSLVASDQIVSIRHYDFSGHVYDLQCRNYELYTIDNLIVKNCRCGVLFADENGLELAARAPMQKGGWEDVERDEKGRWAGGDGEGRVGPGRIGLGRENKVLGRVEGRYTVDEIHDASHMVEKYNTVFVGLKDPVKGMIIASEANIEHARMLAIADVAANVDYGCRFIDQVTDGQKGYSCDLSFAGFVEPDITGSSRWSEESAYNNVFRAAGYLLDAGLPSTTQLEITGFNQPRINTTFHKFVEVTDLKKWLTKWAEDVERDEKGRWVEGGGAAGGAASEARSATASRYAADAKSEPGITSSLQGIAAASGGQMSGLENKLKSEESMERKILAEAEEKGITPLEAEARITDGIRYTMLFESGSFGTSVQDTEAALRAAGYERYDHKYINYFDSQGPYRGVNTVWKSTSTGSIFELQFHTSESLQIKETNHLIYAAFRESTDEVEQAKMYSDMVGNYNGFLMPAGAGGLN